MAIRLNAAQRQAVEYLDGPLLVLAGPGTGKTQLLSSKVAYILEKTDANPENILCLTFTEAGAVNMRNRLLSIVGRAGNRVNIHTYHAFGSDLLARYRNYAEQFDRNFDTPVDAVTQFKIVQKIRENMDAFDILKSSITPTSSIIEVIQSAKSHRLSADDLAIIAETNLVVSKKINAELTPILDDAPKGARYPKAVQQVYQPLLEVLTHYISTEPIVKNIEPEANAIARSLSEALEQVENDPKHSTKPLGNWRDQNFEKDGDNHFRLKNIIANKKLASVANIMREYNARLAAEGLYDFNDMIEETINILKTDDGFRLDLSERYQYILLDEFQDTNPSQFELVRLLTEYEKPCIMAVGDDDQAIYAFQGANASNLIDFQEQYSAKVINLSENYRSTSEILALSKVVAEQITDSFAKKQGVNKTLTAARDAELMERASDMAGALSSSTGAMDGGDSADRIMTSGGSDDKVSTGEISTFITRHEFISPDAEYSWVAGQIRKLIDDGTSPDDIAILAPRHRLILPIIPYLKAENIDIAYEKRENILEDIHIKQLLTIAEFVFELASERNPAHRLLEILSYPFWGLSSLEVITTLHRAKTTSQTKTASVLEQLADSESLEIKNVAMFLANLVTASFCVPLELFLDYLIGTASLEGFQSPYLSYYTGEMSGTNVGDDVATKKVDDKKVIDSTYTAFELYNNLAVLREAIRAHTHTPKPTVKDLIIFIHDYADAEAAVQNTSPYQDASNSVQVMTAHKSKGLEFKHVFLTSLDDKSWGNASGNRNLIVLPKNLTHLRHTGNTENECLRLLFVAMTRAELSLTMTNAVKSFTETTLPRLEYLDEHEDEKHRIVSPYLPNQYVTTHYDDLEQAKSQANLVPHWVSAYQESLPELRPILEKRLENYQLTATDLTSFIDLRYAGPANFYSTRILGAPRDPITLDTVLGNLIHATFEAVTTNDLDDAKALEFFEEKLVNEPVSDNDTEYLLKKGRRALEISLKDFGELLRDKRGKAEVNLQHEHLVLADAPLTGKIDHIHLDTEAKTIEIYDFKTGTFHPKGWTSHDSLYRYSLQLGFYKLLLNLSPTYQKYTVTRGHILYVSPDDEGKVYDKVYEFNEKDETFLKKLVAAVYQQIKTMNFVENSELFLVADANRSVTDIRKFAEKVIEAAT